MRDRVDFELNQPLTFHMGVLKKFTKHTAKTLIKQSGVHLSYIFAAFKLHTHLKLVAKLRKLHLAILQVV